MRLLDLFCGAGLGADGYNAVGFDIVGIDNKPQPQYPYEFLQGNAVDVLESYMPDDFDVIHASPPCQLFTRAQFLRAAQGSVSKETVDLLTPTLEILESKWAHKIWVVENVEFARPLMPGAVRLCGSTFYLQVQRHRLFKANVSLRQPQCAHSRFPLDPISNKPRPWGVYHVPGDNIPYGGRTAKNAVHGREVMGVSRPVSWEGLKEGFPPQYTAHIGADLVSVLARIG